MEAGGGGGEIEGGGNGVLPRETGGEGGRAGVESGGAMDDKNEGDEECGSVSEDEEAEKDEESGREGRLRDAKISFTLALASSMDFVWVSVLSWEEDRMDAVPLLRGGGEDGESDRNYERSK